jgi:hypothetical protein
MNPPEVETNSGETAGRHINELERLKRLVRFLEKYTEENGVTSFGEIN